MNHYPLWKNLTIIAVMLLGLIYALPNAFTQDPVLEVTPTRQAPVDGQLKQRLNAALVNIGLESKAIDQQKDRMIVRFRTSEDQLKANDQLAAALGDDYRLAMTLSTDLPNWVRKLGIQPMYLGLDLRGGVHVVIDVDMDAAVGKALERYSSDMRSLLRKERVRYETVLLQDNKVLARFADVKARDQAEGLARNEFRTLSIEALEQSGQPALSLSLLPADQAQVKKFALQQNITTLRNRVNALGVAEPVIQQQGERRIVVQLPGARDPSKLKEILGATATLEYRQVDAEHSAQDALSGRIPPGSKLYKDRKGTPVLLYKRVIVTGDQITDASSGLDQRTGQPAVFVNLDGQGAKRMRDFTTENVGKPMAVVFIETRTVTRMVEGKPVKQKIEVEEVISVANVLEPFGRRFQTTGLDSTKEAHDLALLLRAGALAAPIEIVEERTVGPSLGQDNIEKGLWSVVIGTLLVMAFMVANYRVFGMIANLALLMNVVLIVAVLSLLQATLTLPGIAGIVLTVGMAVDANVLIYERIREEIRLGSSPQAAIHAGFEKAFDTIFDSNLTTLIAAVALFSFGTGPVKGFAVVLFIGILSSMFTAVMGSRAIVNYLYGGKKLERLSV